MNGAHGVLTLCLALLLAGNGEPEQTCSNDRLTAYRAEVDRTVRTFLDDVRQHRLRSVENHIRKRGLVIGDTLLAGASLRRELRSEQSLVNAFLFDSKKLASAVDAIPPAVSVAEMANYRARIDVRAVFVCEDRVQMAYVTVEVEGRPGRLLIDLMRENRRWRIHCFDMLGC